MSTPEKNRTLASILGVTLSDTHPPKGIRYDGEKLHVAEHPPIPVFHELMHHVVSYADLRHYPNWGMAGPTSLERHMTRAEEVKQEILSRLLVPRVMRRLGDPVEDVPQFLENCRGMLRMYGEKSVAEVTDDVLDVEWARVLESFPGLRLEA